MKKLMISLLITVTLISLFVCQSKDYKYEPGKDTVDIFGDGTYQILRIVDENLKEHKSLYNNEKQESIIENVLNYKEHKSLLYVVGDDKYTIVNYIANKVKQYDDMKSIPKSDKGIFKELKAK
ncbi:hypothetical protein [Thermolongibacillus altinsuensis]|uniref:hypothetical protein n=1 Tax=Thermolongibacillus altinsuensis TaxID=575256 RepID=UPI00242A3215|nr:hypothetical protein [Thermolongibacillus altinsuensis]GMB07384.1 hypothetical protein B1no1_00940 [Thermolongibacillus altinsuensis]